jgi:16S rRNA G966 N2-methylase RsmD
MLMDGLSPRPVPVHLDDPEDDAPALSLYVDLDRRVDEADASGLRARWEFGRLLRSERIGKKLPVGRLEELAAAIGKSQQEISLRMMFADRFPDEEAFSNAVRKYASWHKVVAQGLRSPKALLDLALGEEALAEESDMLPEGLTLPVAADLRCGDFRTTLVDLDGQADVVMTDPPYAREFLPLYDDLGRHAATWLKPGGSLLVMAGQSYLPAVMEALGASLTYHWTVTYLTPGPASHLWARNVNTFWKPVLWFVKGAYAGPCVGDVARSAAIDKRFHEWGQSESGMADLVERFSAPGQLIVDPFMGAGTTGVVAIRGERRFIGTDIDAAAVARATARIAAAHHGGNED